MGLGKLPDDDPSSAEGAIFAEINITPLTDIFLVLLIIFMITSSVMVETASRQGLKVNLPKGATKEIDPGAKSLVVSVLPSGQVMVQGQAVTPSDLDKVFRSAFAKDPQTQVIIEADEGVKHGMVVGIMNNAKQVGLSRLAIATK
ncbi:MAG: biopolymer transporter ExbD [Deltaproteobacteria bacterium]|nr:biopolymer transporter ExbD [Deltaproteobacteria bacterium]